MNLSVRDFFGLLRSAFNELKKNDPLRLAGATAFFTTFALPPILIIVIQLFGLFFNRKTVSDKMFMRLAEVLGRDSVSQIRTTFRGFTHLASNWYYTIGGFVFLMFVATTLFKVIKDSLNQLWNIGIDRTKSLQVTMITRAKSMAVILLAAILFLAGTLAEGLQAIFGHYLNDLLPGAGSVASMIINKVISIIVVTTWFSVLFRFLPDASPSWKVSVAGAFFTGILFTAGKMVIQYFMSLGNINTIFGASGSFVLLLLFVFYSSLMLYYGACFTKAYAAFSADPIIPATHAYQFELTELKSN